MSILKTSRVVVCGGLLAIGVVAVVSGQAGQPAPARTQMDELLAEVRAIRADLDRASAASLRGQLLGMRLQAQEARITALSRQLGDVQDRLRDNQQARVSLTNSLTMFAGQGQKGEQSAEARKQMDFIFAPLKAQLELLAKTDADLKQEEASLLAQLQQEQNRWTSFNGQIEELERAAAKAAR